MSMSQLSRMTDEQLVALYMEICVAQDRALLGGSISKYNKLYTKMRDIATELKTRGSDQRALLLALFSHPNMQVRLAAAKGTLAVAYGDARAQLESIAESKWYPRAGDAGMCLALLDDGTFKPT